MNEKNLQARITINIYEDDTAKMSFECRLTDRVFHLMSDVYATMIATYPETPTSAGIPLASDAAALKEMEGK